jgi:hypothetical protein
VTNSRPINVRVLNSTTKWISILTFLSQTPGVQKVVMSSETNVFNAWPFSGGKPLFYLDRARRFEPPTPTLARARSYPEFRGGTAANTEIIITAMW